MRKIDTRTCLTLLPGRLLSVKAEQDLHLSLDCGLVWVTIEGDEQDYWLQAGASLNLPAVRHIVIEAWRDLSRLELTPLQSNALTQPGSMMLIEEL